MTTEKAVITGNSIRMIMERKSQDRERKAYEQEINKLFIHQLNKLPICKKK
jgi:hypothetical protein